MTWDPDDKRRTALHEAGHAVVAHSFGIAVERIYLDLKNKSGGTVPEPASVALLARLEPFEQIAIALAGFEAEEAFKPPGSKRRALDDHEDKVPVILRNNGTSKDEPEGQALRERGRSFAEERLREHATKVCRIADHLVEYHYMDRVVFEAMMKEH